MLETVLEIVSSLLTYAVAPGILASMMVIGFMMALRANPTQRVPAFAGVGGGFIGFLIYFLMSKNKNAAAEAGLTSVNAASFLPVLVGFAIAYTMLWGVQSTRLRRGIQGLSTLFLTATSSIALYGYFFDSPMRNFAVLFAAGALFGIFCYFIFYHQRFLELLRKSAATN